MKFPASFKNIWHIVAYPVVGCGVTMGAYGGFVYYVDPLQVFHQQRSRQPQVLYYSNTRWQAPGMIRQHFVDNHDKEVAILGASLTKMILPEDISDILGSGLIISNKR